jgi:hypothetical protein
MCCLVVVSWKGDHPAMSPQSNKEATQNFPVSYASGIARSGTNIEVLYIGPKGSNCNQDPKVSRMEVLLTVKKFYFHPCTSNWEWWNSLLRRWTETAHASSTYARNFRHCHMGCKYDGRLLLVDCTDDPSREHSRTSRTHKFYGKGKRATKEF